MVVSDFTAEELSELRRAYAAGTLVVRTGEDEVRYGSAADLLARIRFVEARIGAAAQPLPVAGKAAFRRG
jgi:hypothetical protein